jgi:hypothetical protein
MIGRVLIFTKFDSKRRFEAVHSALLLDAITYSNHPFKLLKMVAYCILIRAVRIPRLPRLNQPRFDVV